MKVLVTGGGGFLGGAIIQALLKKNYTIRSIGRRESTHLKAYGVEVLSGDLSDPTVVQTALKGIDAIIHTAAKAGIWGPRKEFYKHNYLATQHLLREAQHTHIRYVVYTSTPSVAIGKQDICHKDESLPYAEPFLCHYAATKALAEQAVLAASRPSFRTLALRPHLIWGKGDPHLVPTLLHKASQKKLIQVGNGQNRVDLTHVDNAAHAHVLALDALRKGKGVGKAYFISDDAPVVLWEWIQNLLEALNLPPIQKQIGFNKAYRLGYILEKCFAFLKHPPPLTRFLAIQLGKSHYFDVHAAKLDLGYKPIQDPQEAMVAYVEDLKLSTKLRKA